MENTENRSMVISFLEHGDSSDAQIIDLLLLLLDDWEVRSAVMGCITKRKESEQVCHYPTKTETTTSTTTSSDKSKT